MTQSELRAKIDEADDEIVAALKKRFELTAAMRELKAREGLPRVDEAREREIMAKVAAAVEPRDMDTVCGVYESILKGSRGTIETIARGVAIVGDRLLVCRAKGAETCYLPGGHIEFGETGREALVRELREETGRETRAGELLGVVENSFMQHGRKHAEINLVYRLEILGEGEVVAQEAWIDFEWVELAKLGGARLLPEEMIGRLDDWKVGGLEGWK